MHTNRNCLSINIHTNFWYQSVGRSRRTSQSVSYWWFWERTRR